MPIEIKELHIRAVIDSGGGKTASEEVNARETPSSGEGSAANAEQLVELCVEKVMEILKLKNER